MLQKPEAKGRKETWKSRRVSIKSWVQEPLTPCVRAMNTTSLHYAGKRAGTARIALKNKLMKTAEKREWIKPVKKWRALEIEHFSNFNASGRSKANDGWFSFAIELWKDLIYFHSNLLFARLASMEYILLPCNMLAIITVSLWLLREGKLQLLWDLCHHPRVSQWGGGVGNQKISIYSRGFHQIFKLLLKEEALKTFFDGDQQLWTPLPSTHPTPMKLLIDEYHSSLNSSSAVPS